MARRCRPADDERFRRLYASHAGDVVRYALRRVSTPDAAEDVAAETFAVAWRRRAEAPDDPLPWLYRIAWNVIAHERRAARRRAALVGRLAAQPLAPAAAPASLEPLLAALARLSERDRE